MQKINYTPAFLSKLEDLISECGYVMRYEKGNFRSGYCILKSNNILIINKFLTTEGRINTILDLLKELTIDRSHLSDKSKELLDKIIQPSLELPNTNGNQ